MLERPAEPGALGDRAGRERTNDFGDESPAPRGDGVIDVAELLIALPGPG